MASKAPKSPTESPLNVAGPCFPWAWLSTPVMSFPASPPPSISAWIMPWAGLTLLLTWIIHLCSEALTGWAGAFPQQPVEANAKVSLGISAFQIRTVIAAQHCSAAQLSAPEPEPACLGLGMPWSSRMSACPGCCRAAPEHCTQVSLHQHGPSLPAVRLAGFGSSLRPGIWQCSYLESLGAALGGSFSSGVAELMPRGRRLGSPSHGGALCCAQRAAAGKRSSSGRKISPCRGREHYSKIQQSLR